MIDIPGIEKELLINLKIDLTNPNVMTKEQIQSVANSIKKYGFLIPIIVNKDNVIIDGHQRKNAAELLEMVEVPVIRLNVDKVDAKLLKQIMNKLKGHHDYDLDLAEYKVILEEQGSLDVLKQFVAMDDDYLNNILAELKPKGQHTDEELEEVPEADTIKTDIQYGDIIQLGNHRIMCGDSTKKEDVDKLMNGQKADMIFTDPPYGLGGYGGRNNMALKGDDEDVQKFYDCIPLDISEVYIWGNAYNMVNLREKPRDVIVWKKNNFGLGKGYRGQYELCFYYGTFAGSDSDVWEESKDGKYEHPTQKPVSLALRAIKNSNPKELVLDLFLGSGSTLIACEQTNRKCIGMELDNKYCQVIVNRYNKLYPDKEIKCLNREVKLINN